MQFLIFESLCQQMNKPATELALISDSVPTPRLQNVVSTHSIGLEQLNLRTLVLRCGFLDFDSKRFAVAVMRIRNPQTTCLVFASGN